MERTAIIHFTIDGKAEPQGRPRATKMGNNIKLYDPPKSKAYKRVVGLIAQSYMSRNQLEPYTGALKVTLGFCFKPPKSYTQKRLKSIQDGTELYTKKSDIDNLAKAVTDGMNQITYNDDAQIVALNITKQYADDDYTTVKIEPLQEDKMIKDYEQLAADRGVRTQLFHRRIKQGFTPEQAAEPVLVSALDMVTAREHGISRRTIYKRLKQGMEKHEALTAPDTRKNNNNPYEQLLEPAERFTKDETLFMIQQFRKYNIKLNNLLLRRAEEYQINVREVT